MITAAALFIWNTLKAFLEILRESAIARYVAFGIVVALIVAVALLSRNCKSRTEQRIEDRAPVIVEQQQGVNAAANLATNATQTAVNAGKLANQAQANVIAVQRDRKTNVSLEEANRNRCLAFPDSEGCQ